MSELRTDFKDDVLDVTQNEKRKYRVIHNEDGTISLEDATVYLQQGDSFGANDLNEMNRMANQMNEAAGEILTMADDIDTLQEDVETLEGDTTTLQSDMTLVKDTLGYTTKNLLENTATTTTSNGVTFTVNDDGSVTVNGTATVTTYFTINEHFNLPNGEYILNGCSDGGSTSTYYLQVYNNVAPSINGYDFGEGVNFVVNDNNTIGTVRIYVVVGTTVNNLTFYPMIRKVDITDDTYEPYVNGSVDARLEEIEPIVSELNKTIDVNNVLVSMTSLENNAVYTATKDCYIALEFYTQFYSNSNYESRAYVLLNGVVKVGESRAYTGSCHGTRYDLIKLKKGEYIKGITGRYGTINYTVYGTK